MDRRAAHSDPVPPEESPIRVTDVHGAGNTVAFVVKGYPRLSETFIAQEIHALERRGLDIRLFSLRHPTDRCSHPVHDEIAAPVRYLPEYLHHAPLRVWRAWRSVRRRPGYRAARRTWLKDLLRDKSRNRVRRFGQALVLAHDLPREVRQLHAHFLHTPASVARYAARIANLPWSCSAHAKDIWTTPDWEIREKLADMSWLVTCTKAGHAKLETLAPRPERVSLVYHGLDFDRFPSHGAQVFSTRDGTEAEDPVLLLSVGRAVPKKGYGVLLAALAQIPASLHWRLDHIGGGPELAALRRQAEQLGLASRITWRGARAQDEVLAAYRSADLFVLASVVARDGDRDGLPNVLMEAQSQGLACLSTQVSGIPELIEDGGTGVLVAPGQIPALRDALARLIAEPDLRRRLGTAGAARLRHEFSLERGIDILADKFGIPAPGDHGTSECALPSMRP